MTMEILRRLGIDMHEGLIPSPHPMSSLADPRNSMVYVHMGVSKNKGTPKWMVYDGKPY